MSVSGGLTSRLRRSLWTVLQNECEQGGKFQPFPYKLHGNCGWSYWGIGSSSTMHRVSTSITPAITRFPVTLLVEIYNLRNGDLRVSECTSTPLALVVAMSSQNPVIM